METEHISQLLVDENAVYAELMNLIHLGVGRDAISPPSFVQSNYFWNGAGGFSDPLSSIQTGQSMADRQYTRWNPQPDSNMSLRNGPQPPPNGTSQSSLLHHSYPSTIAPNFWPPVSTTSSQALWTSVPTLLYDGSDSVIERDLRYCTPPDIVVTVPPVASARHLPVTIPPSPPSPKQGTLMSGSVDRYLESLQRQSIPRAIQDLEAMTPVPFVRSQGSAPAPNGSPRWYSRGYSCAEVARVLLKAMSYVEVGKSKLQIYLDRRANARLLVEEVIDLSSTEVTVDIRDSLEDLFKGAWPRTEALWPSVWKIPSTSQVVLRLTEVPSQSILRSWTNTNPANSQEWLTFTPADNDIYLEVSPQCQLRFPACAAGISAAMRKLVHKLPSVLLSYDHTCSCTPLPVSQKLKMHDIPA